MSEPRLNLNLVVLCGRLAADPEHTMYDSGASVWRLLLTIKQTEPRTRVDVIPVTVWEGDGNLELGPEFKALVKGDVVAVQGSMQRRFWESPDGRRSRMEVVAHSVYQPELVPEEERSYAAVPFGSGSYVARGAVIEVIVDKEDSDES